MATPDKSWLQVQCLDGMGSIDLPVDVEIGDVTTLLPLTVGKVLELRHSTAEPVTDAKAAAGKPYEKAVIVLKNIPASGDDKIYRISIPAPDLNTAAGITTVGDGNKEYIPKSSSATGNDGDALAGIFHTALSLTGSTVFLSGKIYQYANKG